MKTRILPMIVLVFLMLGCGGDRDPEGSDGGSRPAERATTATRPSKPTKVLVTSDDASLPDGCHPRQIAGLVIDFIDAFNSGDQERLARLFFVSEGPSPPDFSEEGYYPWSWYSVSEVGAGGRIQDGFVTYDQRELLRYFAQRHRKGSISSLSRSARRRRACWEKRATWASSTSSLAAPKTSSPGSEARRA
jgi:hypothetical protein